MKVRADEHVSPHIVNAIRDIALSSDWEITTIREAKHTGKSDVHWITKFADDGGDAILTADTDFLILEPQVNAVFATGLRVIHLPPKWGNARGYLQAAHMLQWWKRIETKIKEMKPRECYRPQWNINETGELKKVTIDFAKAQKKKKKALRKLNNGKTS